MDYHLTGSKNKQTILFLHGLGADLSQFEEQQKYFASNYRTFYLTSSKTKPIISLYHSHRTQNATE